jgi:nucleosome assembly protein 1-like 1
LYARRHAIITGTSQPTPEEVEAGEKQSLKDDSEYAPLPKDIPAATTGIPEFWRTALRNHPGISDLITDRDAEALKHLIDIRISYIPNTEPKPGFKLSFVFSPNEYFENEVLEKTYVYQEEVGYSGDFVYDRAIGTEIRWKDEKDLTKEFEIKKQRNKSGLYLSETLLLLRSDKYYPVCQTRTVRDWSAKLVQRNLSSTFSLLRCLLRMVRITRR